MKIEGNQSLMSLVKIQCKQFRVAPESSRLHSHWTNIMVHIYGKAKVYEVCIIKYYYNFGGEKVSNLCKADAHNRLLGGSTQHLHQNADIAQLEEQLFCTQ